MVELVVLVRINMARDIPIHEDAGRGQKKRNARNIMATIHHIDHETVRRSSRTETPKPATAEIILFPGVRYERWVESRPMAHSSGRIRAKRDRLEIVD